MRDFRTLKFLDRFRRIFNSIGVDYDIMRKILEVKLTMDGRRVPTIINNSSKRKSKDQNKDKNNFLRSLWIYSFIGLIMIPFVVMGKNYIFQMSFVFGIIVFMVMSSLISDFSSVLLDIRDKNIIFTKPVNSKTISMAKTIHILIYMFFVTIAMAGPALAASLLRHGVLFFIIFLLEIILVDMFIVVLTALLYLLILKFFDGEKLKDIINYVQIALSIAIALGYQLIGRLFDVMHLNVVFTPKWWQYFILPVWFGGPFEILIHRNYNIHFVIFSVLAVIVPIISIIVYIKLIPSFERNLQKLSNNGSNAEKGYKILTKTLSKIICRTKEERTFFRFASSMMRKERDFKLKVYPSLGFSIIFPFIFIMNSMRTETFKSLISGNMYFNIYFCALMLPTSIIMIKYSGRYKGAWIYKVMPIKNKTYIYKGTVKAFVASLLCPVYILESIIFIALFGVRIVPDIIIVFLTILLFVVICFNVLDPGFPFSEPFEAAQQGNGFLKTILLFIVLAIFAGIHFAFTFMTYGLYIYIGIMIMVNIIAWKFTFNP